MKPVNYYYNNNNNKKKIHNNNNDNNNNNNNNDNNHNNNILLHKQRGNYGLQLENNDNISIKVHANCLNNTKG